MRDEPALKSEPQREKTERERERKREKERERSQGIVERRVLTEIL